jgi:hypothetical protein
MHCAAQGCVDKLETVANSFRNGADEVVGDDGGSFRADRWAQPFPLDLDHKSYKTFSFRDLYDSKIDGEGTKPDHA